MHPVDNLIKGAVENYLAEGKKLESLSDGTKYMVMGDGSWRRITFRRHQLKKQNGTTKRNS